MSSIEDRAKKAKDVSNEEWEKMKSMISDQLDNVTSSLNELRENGSLDTISQMIKRGDTCPSARLQAWYHAMLEVEYCNRPYSVFQKLQYMYNSHRAKGPDEAPQSFILDTSLTAETSGKEEWKRRSGRPLETPESVVARLERKRNLTVVERQELWLAKKSLKAAKAQSLIAEERMQERAKSAPDISRSQRSFTMLAQERKKVAVEGASAGASTRRRSSLINEARERRPSTVARKRSMSTRDGLGNITNTANRPETSRRKRAKRGPITDLFSQKSR